MAFALAARPTTYNGIRMRSRLEAKVAAQLDSFGIDWIYEPRAYANGFGQYLPDFQLFGRKGEPYEFPSFLEVRPTIERAYLAMPQMGIIWDSEPNAFLMIHLLDVLDFACAGWIEPRTWVSCPPW